MAVDRGITNFDGIISGYLYNGILRHNYYWYHDDESDLFLLIPWDLDLTFMYPEPNFWTNNAPTGSYLVPNWNVVNSSYNPIPCSFDPGQEGIARGTGYQVYPIDKDKFLRLMRNTTWDDFIVQSRIFLDSVFLVDTVAARVARWRSRIASAVGKDATLDSTEWEIMVDSLLTAIPLIRNNLEMMIDTLLVQ
jgi:hypothetical protein